MAKKTRAQKAQDLYEKQAASVENAGQSLSQGIAEAGEKEVESIEAAGKARTQALNEAQSLYRQAMDEGHTQFADIVLSASQRLKDAQAEDQQQKELERKRVAWTGAGELVASLANLFTVGAGAQNQQIHSYSQDWQRKAEQDARERRNRMYSLNDHLNQMKIHQNQLMMGNAKEALALARENSNVGYQNAAALADARYKAQTAPLNIQYQAARDAGAARTQGGMSAINVGLQEARIAEERRDNEENVAMRAARYGLKRNDDGTYSADPQSPITKASNRAGGGGGGTGRNTLYYYDDDNQLVPVYMTSKEYDEFVNQSYAALTGNEEFTKAYRRAGTDTERKSLIYQYAIQDPARRAILSQYSANPEMTRREEKKEEEKKVESGRGDGYITFEQLRESLKK